jgi:uncharacterized protein (TIGR02996 family)
MFLVEVTAPDGTTRRSLAQRTALTLGSGPGNTVTVPGSKVEHATITLRAAYSEVSCKRDAEVMVDGTPFVGGEHLAQMPATLVIAGHTIVIRDVTAPRFEASYGAIAPAEAALVDAIVTGDAASRIVYADWLEERGETSRAEIVRRLADGESPDGELLVELARTNVRWRARVLEPAIEGCTRADCPKHWGLLERNVRADMRRCATCTKLVLYAVDNGQAKEHQSDGGKVVFDPFAVRDALTGRR